MRIVTNASKFSPKSSRYASDIYRSKPSAACSSLLPSCLATILSAIEMVVNSEAALRCALRRVDNHLHGRYPLNKQKRRIMRLWRLLIKGIGVNRWFPFKRKARVLSLTLSTVCGSRFYRLPFCILQHRKVYKDFANSLISFSLASDLFSAPLAVMMPAISILVYPI